MKGATRTHTCPIGFNVAYRGQVEALSAHEGMVSFWANDIVHRALFQRDDVMWKHALSAEQQDGTPLHALLSKGMAVCVRRVTHVAGDAGLRRGLCFQAAIEVNAGQTHALITHLYADGACGYLRHAGRPVLFRVDEVFVDGRSARIEDQQQPLLWVGQMVRVAYTQHMRPQPWVLSNGEQLAAVCMEIKASQVGRLVTFSCMEHSLPKLLPISNPRGTDSHSSVYSSFESLHPITSPSGRSFLNASPVSQGNALLGRGPLPRARARWWRPRGPENQGQNRANQDQSPANHGQSPVNQGKSPANQGKSPANHGHSPENHGQSPANQGKSLANHGHSTANHGQSPANQGKSPANHGHSPANHGQSPAHGEPQQPVYGQGSWCPVASRAGRGDGGRDAVIDSQGFPRLAFQHGGYRGSKAHHLGGANVSIERGRDPASRTASLGNLAFAAAAAQAIPGCAPEIPVSPAESLADNQVTSEPDQAQANACAAKATEGVASVPFAMRINRRTFGNQPGTLVSVGRASRDVNLVSLLADDPTFTVAGFYIKYLSVDGRRMEIGARDAVQTLLRPGMQVRVLSLTESWLAGQVGHFADVDIASGELHRLAVDAQLSPSKAHSVNYARVLVGYDRCPERDVSDADVEDVAIEETGSRQDRQQVAVARVEVEDLDATVNESGGQKSPQAFPVLDGQQVDGVVESLSASRRTGVASFGIDGLKASFVVKSLSHGRRLVPKTQFKDFMTLGMAVKLNIARLVRHKAVQYEATAHVVLANKTEESDDDGDDETLDGREFVGTVTQLAVVHDSCRPRYVDVIVNKRLVHVFIPQRDVYVDGHRLKRSSLPAGFCHIGMTVNVTHLKRTPKKISARICFTESELKSFTSCVTNLDSKLADPGASENKQVSIEDSDSKLSDRVANENKQVSNDDEYSNSVAKATEEEVYEAANAVGPKAVDDDYRRTIASEKSGEADSSLPETAHTGVIVAVHEVTEGLVLPKLVMVMIDHVETYASIKPVHVKIDGKRIVDCKVKFTFRIGTLLTISQLRPPSSPGAFTHRAAVLLTDLDFRLLTFLEHLDVAEQNKMLRWAYRDANRDAILESYGVDHRVALELRALQDHVGAAKVAFDADRDDDDDADVAQVNEHLRFNNVTGVVARVATLSAGCNEVRFTVHARKIRAAFLRSSMTIDGRAISRKLALCGDLLKVGMLVKVVSVSVLGIAGFGYLVNVDLQRRTILAFVTSKDTVVNERSTKKADASLVKERLEKFDTVHNALSSTGNKGENSGSSKKALKRTNKELSNKLASAEGRSSSVDSPRRCADVNGAGEPGEGCKIPARGRDQKEARQPGNSAADVCRQKKANSPKNQGVKFDQQAKGISEFSSENQEKTYFETSEANQIISRKNKRKISKQSALDPGNVISKPEERNALAVGAPSKARRRQSIVPKLTFMPVCPEPPHPCVSPVDQAEWLKPIRAGIPQEVKLPGVTGARIENNAKLLTVQFVLDGVAQTAIFFKHRLTLSGRKLAYAVAEDFDLDVGVRVTVTSVATFTGGSDRFKYLATVDLDVKNKHTQRRHHDEDPTTTPPGAKHAAKEKPRKASRSGDTRETHVKFAKRTLETWMRSIDVSADVGGLVTVNALMQRQVAQGMSSEEALWLSKHTEETLARSLGDTQIETLQRAYNAASAGLRRELKVGGESDEIPFISDALPGLLDTPLARGRGRTSPGGPQSGDQFTSKGPSSEGPDPRHTPSETSADDSFFPMPYDTAAAANQGHSLHDHNYFKIAIDSVAIGRPIRLDHEASEASDQPISDEDTETSDRPIIDEDTCGQPIRRKDTEAEGPMRGKDTEAEGPMREKDTEAEGPMREKDTEAEGPIREKDTEAEGPMRVKDTETEGPIREKDTEAEGPMREKDTEAEGPMRVKDSETEGPMSRRTQIESNCEPSDVFDVNMDKVLAHFDGEKDKAFAAVQAIEDRRHRAKRDKRNAVTTDADKAVASGCVRNDGVNTNHAVNNENTKVKENGIGNREKGKNPTKIAGSETHHRTGTSAKNSAASDPEVAAGSVKRVTNEEDGCLVTYNNFIVPSLASHRRSTPVKVVHVDPTVVASDARRKVTALNDAVHRTERLDEDAAIECVVRHGDGQQCAGAALDQFAERSPRLGAEIIISLLDSIVQGYGNVTLRHTHDANASSDRSAKSDAVATGNRGVSDVTATHDMADADEAVIHADEEAAVGDFSWNLHEIFTRRDAIDYANNASVIAARSVHHITAPVNDVITHGDNVIANDATDEDVYVYYVISRLPGVNDYVTEVLVRVAEVLNVEADSGADYFVDCGTDVKMAVNGADVKMADDGADIKTAVDGADVKIADDDGAEDDSLLKIGALTVSEAGTLPSKSEILDLMTRDTEQEKELASFQHKAAKHQAARDQEAKNQEAKHHGAKHQEAKHHTGLDAPKLEGEQRQ